MCSVKNGGNDCFARDGENRFHAVFDTDLEDAFESGRVSAAEFLRQFRSVCRLRCDDDALHAELRRALLVEEATGGTRPPGGS